MGFFTIHSVAKHQKIEGMKIFYFRKKISQCRKKTERGDPLEFSNIHFVAKQQKIEGGTLWRQKKISKKKSHSAEKTQRGDPIVSSGFVSYDKNGVTERGDPLHYLKYAPRLPIQYFSLVVLFCEKCPLRIHSVI